MAKEEGGAWLTSIDTCNVRVRLKPHSDEASESLVVHAQSQLLCKIPYFAASLSQAWHHRDADTSFASAQCNLGHSDLTLECVPFTSPEDYLLCLQYLNPHCFKLPSTVDCILKVLRSADHLLYKECADICMAFLAAKVWSDEEEASIRMAVSTIGLMLSSDLRMKLDPFDNVHILKDVLLQLAQDADMGESAAMALQDLVKQVISKAPPFVVQSSASCLMEAWMSASDEFTRFSVNQGIKWCALTGALLLYKDAKELLHAFVVKSKELSLAMQRASYVHGRGAFEEILTCLFLRVIPGKDEDLVLLSGSQRACLVTTWAPLIGKLEYNARLNSALADLISTLPVQDPSVVALVKKEASKKYFQQCYKWWRTELVKHLCRSDRPDLEANGSKDADQDVIVFRQYYA